MAPHHRRHVLQDNEAVLEYLLQREDAGRAISLLRRPDVSQELLYKFAPGLMALAPEETVQPFPHDLKVRELKKQECSKGRPHTTRGHYLIEAFDNIWTRPFFFISFELR